ncbi:MAG: O-antigen ligase family protein [Candidatus Kerfeldbacteria bacterium]|nr:O-antigen ligase family protein [Candidatus Kerfeldbacteria bacterium]
MIIAILFSIITIVLTIKNRVWGVAFVLLLLPSYLIRFSIFGIPFTLLEVMIIVLFFIHIIKSIVLATPFRAFIPSWFDRLTMTRWSTPLSLLKDASNKFWYGNIALLLIASVIGLLVTPDIRAGAGIWKAYIIEPILFFIICTQSIRTRKDVALCLSALGLSATIIAAVAVFQYFTGWHIPAPWHDLPNRRATAFYGYPNAVGLYIAPILTMLIGTLLSGFFTGRKKNLAMVCMIILCFGALIVSRSDGAIVAVIAATGCMLLFTKWRWATLTIGTVGLMLALTLPPIRHVLLFQDVSGDVRLALWTGTLHLLRAHPFVGSGLAGFPILYDIYRLPSHIELLEYAHNIFFDFWVQLGLLGLIWIMMILIYSFITIAKTIHAKKPLGLILFGVFISILVYGLVDVPYFKNDLSILFWFWLSLLFVQKLFAIEEKNAS